jgi:hypothetical protein
VIESQTKAQSKITWRRQVSDPLGKGNGTTHLRQNKAPAKSANHRTKAQTPQRAPSPHMQAPPEPMHLPLDECMQTSWKQGSCSNFSSQRSDRSSPPVRPVPNMCTGPALTPVRPVTLTGQTGAQQSPEMVQTTWKPCKCVQQAISSSNFSPLMAMHESSQKCKIFNLELLK